MKTTKLEKENYIKAHWTKMSDEEMAAKLDCKWTRVKTLRSKMGLKRKDNEPGNRDKINAYILAHPQTTEQDALTAQVFGLTKGTVATYRYMLHADNEKKTELANIKAYIREHWQDMPDQAIADSLGIQKQRVYRIRREMGFEKRSRPPTEQQRKVKAFIDEHHLTMTGTEMAAALNMDYSTLYKEMRKLGYRVSDRRDDQNKAVRQHIQDNGTKSNERLARELDLSVSRVSFVRAEMGLGTYAVRHEKRHAAEEYIRTHYETQTDKELADALGLSFRTVQVIRQSIGIYRKAADIKVKRRTDFILEHAASMTIYDMAKELQMKPDSVAGYLRKYGIEPLKPLVSEKVRMIASDVTPETLDLIKENYKDMPDEELTKLIEQDYDVETVQALRRALGCFQVSVPATASASDLDYIRAHYLDMTDREIASRIDRPVATVKHYREKMGLRKTVRGNHEITDDEVLLYIFENYQDQTVAELAAHLGVTVDSIRSTMKTRGLTAISDREKKARTKVQGPVVGAKEEKLPVKQPVFIPIKDILEKLFLFRRNRSIFITEEHKLEWLRQRSLHMVHDPSTGILSIDADLFWDWLERNKLFFDLTSFRVEELGQEPDWLIEHRRKDAVANGRADVEMVTAPMGKLKEFIPD